MRLLFDENFSRKLVACLADLFAEFAHVAELGLHQTADRDIWEYAGAHDFAIVTADSDFYELVTNLGPPPKVIWLRRWIHPTKDAERVLRREAVRISRFLDDEDLGVLVLDRD